LVARAPGDAPVGREAVADYAARAGADTRARPVRLEVAGDRDDPVGERLDGQLRGERRLLGAARDPQAEELDAHEAQGHHGYDHYGHQHLDEGQAPGRGDGPHRVALPCWLIVTVAVRPEGVSKRTACTPSPIGLPRGS